MDIKNVEKLKKELDAVLAQAAEMVAIATQKAVDEIVQSNVEPQYVKAYREAFNVALQGQNTVVSFQTSDKKISSMEYGIKSYSIKDKMLKPGKKGVKISSEGYAYKTVAIEKELLSGKKYTKAKPREKEIQDEIMNIISSVKFKFKASFNSKEGFHVTDMSETGGVLRVKNYETAADYNAGAKPKSVGAVVFRTMSAKPGSGGWMHPGSEGKHLLKEVEQWKDENDHKIFNEVVDELMEMYFK